jgi:transcription elongation factor GreA
MSNDKVPMTPDGYAALEKEAKHLKTVERPRIIKAIAEARAHGDLSENAEYHAAKEQQGLTEARVLELEDTLARAQVIDVLSMASDSVKFGATVTVVDEDTEEEIRYQIVGDFESDASNGKLSISSPVARALMGKKVGDSTEVATPGGGRYFEILKIEYL